MDSPRREIARERIRMMQVRTVFERVVADAEPADARLVDFYLACARYMVFAMDRLHDQDQAIHDLLAERIPHSDVEAHERLAELQQRQGLSRRLMDRCRDATEALAAAGKTGVESFAEFAREFAGSFKSLMAPRKNPFRRYTDELFGDADWMMIAAVSDESLATEEKLFVAVRRAAPAGNDPDQVTVRHE